MSTVFLLSPAHCGGKRGQLLLSGERTFELAVRLRDTGVPIGEVFSFLSALYFRGKLAYARAFGRPLVITPGHGLVPSETVVTLDDLRGIAAVGVAAGEPRFRDPLERDVVSLAAGLAEDQIVVLLGSIATDKYVEVVAGRLDGRLRFPADFVGRGDMSRGGLLLRRVLAGAELDYVPVAGTPRRGKRPPRLGREKR